MDILKWATLALIMMQFISCSTEPQPIEYHVDQCADCKMNISDQRFGAELVTIKGKIYKYDAAECMIRAVNLKGEAEFEHILVTDFNKPKQFIDATSATFLISELRPSPMGANLSSYVGKDQIEATMINEEAKILDWNQILDYF